MKKRVNSSRADASSLIWYRVGEREREDISIDSTCTDRVRVKSRYNEDWIYHESAVTEFKWSSSFRCRVCVVFLPSTWNEYLLSSASEIVIHRSPYCPCELACVLCLSLFSFTFSLCVLTHVHSGRQGERRKSEALLIPIGIVDGSIAWDQYGATCSGTIAIIVFSTLSLFLSVSPLPQFTLLLLREKRQCSWLLSLYFACRRDGWVDRWCIGPLFSCTRVCLRTGTQWKEVIIVSTERTHLTHRHKWWVSVHYEWPFEKRIWEEKNSFLLSHRSMRGE